MASGRIYSDDELASFLASIFNIDVSKKDVIECKPEFVQRIYSFYLKDFGASLDKIHQVPLNAPRSITQYPDMFKSTCFLTGLAKTICYYLDLIYRTSSDFAIIDLIQPNRTRTKKFFILFLEFYDYIYHNLDRYEAIENEAVFEKIKFEKMRDKIKALESEINQRQIKNAEYEICLQKEMEQFSEAKKEFEKVQITKNKLKEQLDEIKNESKAVISKIKKTELEILEGKERMQILEMQVIQDEEMTKIQEQEALLTSLKNSNAELKNQRKDLNRTLQIIKDIEKFVSSSLLSVLKEIEQEHIKNKEAESMANEFKKISLALMEKLEDLSRSQQELIENMNLMQEKQAIFQNAKEVKKNGLLEEIKQLRLNVSELRISNEKHSSAKRDLVAEIKKCKEEFKNKEMKLKYFLSVVEECYTNIIKKITEMDLKKNRRT